MTHSDLRSVNIELKVGAFSHTHSKLIARCLLCVMVHVICLSTSRGALSLIIVHTRNALLSSYLKKEKF